MKKLLILPLALACGATTNVVDDDNNGQQGEVETDEFGPVIEHDEIQQSQPGGVDVQVTAEVWDEEGDVLQVKLFYSQWTSTDWQEVAMVFQASSGEFRATIPGIQVGSSDMRYYIWAMDDVYNESVDPRNADIDRQDAYVFGVSM